MVKSSTPQASLRILVVDDDPAILRVWRRVLEPKSSLPGAAPSSAPPEAALLIDTALQGAEGFQKVVSALAEGRPYTFALVDMRMPPGWDGLETVLRMLEKDPRLEVGICSAFSDITREEVTRRVGRTDMLWIRKPFDLETARELSRKLGEQGLHRRQAR